MEVKAWEGVLYSGKAGGASLGRTGIGADGREAGQRGKKGKVNGNEARVTHFYALFKGSWTSYSSLILMSFLKTRVLTSIRHFEGFKNSLIMACTLNTFYDLNVIIIS